MPNMPGLSEHDTTAIICTVHLHAFLTASIIALPLLPVSLSI
jgi:hypothetical protein